MEDLRHAQFTEDYQRYAQFTEDYRRYAQFTEASAFLILVCLCGKQTEQVKPKICTLYFTLLYIGVISGLAKVTFLGGGKAMWGQGRE